MIGFDLFCGAGGMSIGAIIAGIKPVVAIDNDKHALATYKHNIHDSETVLCDLRSAGEPLFHNKPNPDIVFGGPPCQGFSISNQRTRGEGNIDNWLFMEFIRIVSLVRPRAVVLENVKGILETCKGSFFDRITTRLKRLGYKVTSQILNAKDYGVPQSRSRLFIVALKGKRAFKFPSVKTLATITVNDAIADLPHLENGASVNSLPYKTAPQSFYAEALRHSFIQCSNNIVTKNSNVIIERYKHVPQGGNWENIPKNLMDNYKDITRCHTGIYRRLHPDEPSVVIGNFRKNMLIHPHEHRGLSVREAARIQSFPDWYEFLGSIGFQQQQVGNAVPPLLAKAVFESLKNHM